MIMPRFSDSPTFWFISAKVWDGLPENMKTFLESVSNDVEKAGLTWCSKWEYDTIIKYMDEDKVKLVWASPAEEDKLIKAFRTDNLDDIAKKSPKYGQKIRDLLKDY
jgi:TRAP-type C4-dicarboxylate transport system substrate-binding protein